MTPGRAFYRSGGTDALFAERGARPFLWRNLIKKELIDKNNFRLDEKIVVGEDQAFQFKVFPAASRVAFIPDKLYYYRFNRPDSIMNEPKYKDYGNRILKHVNMIDSILQSWQKHMTIKKNAVKLFEWAVDFIFWDIIRVSVVDRVHIARRFCKVLSDNGYFLFLNEYSSEIRNEFDYIYGLTNYETEDPLITVAVIMGREKDNMGPFLNSILSQSEKRIEILLYENDSDEFTKKLAMDYLIKDPRICVRLGEMQPVSEKYNDAIVTGKGSYICFLNSYEYIQNISWLKDASGILQNNRNIDIVGFKDGIDGEQDIKYCQNACYRQFLYRIEKIRNSRLGFVDYSLLTGKVFLTKYLLVADKAFFIPKFMVESEAFQKTSICAEDVRLILQAAVWLLKVAKDNGLELLAKNFTSWLNSEKVVRFFADATYGVCSGGKDDCSPDDFQSEILSLLFQLNELVGFESGDSAVLRLLSVFIKKRHQFLENF